MNMNLIHSTPATSTSETRGAVQKMLQYMEMRRCIDRIFDRVDSPRIVAVTSLVPGEGKTTFCLAAAWSLAERLGRKVLVVDTANLVRSKSTILSEVCGVEMDRPFEVQKVQGGPASMSYTWIPPSMGSTRTLKAQIERLSADFDVVIMDTVALSISSRLENDPLEMASVANAMVLVRGETRIELDANVKLEELQNAGVRVLGIVANRFGGVA
jgi:Mrp family chromosome partitioning ATPase